MKIKINYLVSRQDKYQNIGANCLNLYKRVCVLIIIQNLFILTNLIDYMVKIAQVTDVVSKIRRGFTFIREFWLSAFGKCKYIFNRSGHKTNQLKEANQMSHKSHIKRISKQQLRRYVMNRVCVVKAKGQKKRQALSIQENAHQFKLKEKRKQQDFLAFIREHAEEIICSICRSELLNPVTTPCNHVFCLQCIEKSLLISQQCPLCRHAVSTQQNYGLNQYPFVRLFISIKYQHNQSKQYEERIKEFASWKEERFIKDQTIAVGMKIDVWKLQSKEWKPAEIVQLQRDQSSTLTFLLIKYDQQSKQSNQIIDMPSLRIAKHHYYSKIPPKYELTLTSYRIHNSPSERFQFQFSQPLPRRWNLQLPMLPQRPNPFSFVTNRFMAMRRLSPDQQVSPSPSSIPYRSRIINSLHNLNTGAPSDSESDEQNAGSAGSAMNQLNFGFGGLGAANMNPVNLNHLNPQSVEHPQQRQSEIELLLNLNPTGVVHSVQQQEQVLNNDGDVNETLELNQSS